MSSGRFLFAFQVMKPANEKDHEAYAIIPANFQIF